MGVIGEADGAVEAGGHVGHRADIGVLQDGRVAGHAVEHHHAGRSGGERGVAGRMHLGQVGHADGDDQGFAPGGRIGDQRQVHGLEGGDLEGRRPQAVQQVHGALVEGAGEQGHPAPGGPLEQGGVPLVGGLGLLVELMQAAAVPQPAVDFELRPVDVHGDGVGGIGLDLDSVGAGVGRGVDHRQRPVQAAVVVPRQFADHVGRVVGPDPATGDLDVGGVRHGRPSSVNAEP